MTVDISGNVYLSDTGNCAIRLINKHTGIIKTVAGTVSGHCGSSGDGFAAVDARLNHPLGISLDSMNNLFIADSQNNKIRVVSSDGIITTFAGTGGAGRSGDGGLAVDAYLDNPYGVAVDNFNKVYIADANNQVIRVVDSTGIITTIVDQLIFPAAVALDLGGNLYIADAGSNNILKVTMTSGSSRVITTIAGSSTGSQGYSGDGGAAVDATLNVPTGVTVDNSGNVYIADYMNNVVRIVAYDTGIITTYAGGGTMGVVGDDGPATGAYLSSPNAVTIDQLGTLYIADSLDHRVREVVPGTFNYPTSQPTNQPVAQPTLQPIATPTSQPTHCPSEEPSYQPLARPTGQPSQMPMPRPTGMPSSNPSHQPVGRPSGQPAAFPTIQPVANPTLQPTERPTSQPTKMPMPRPTGMPTEQPSTQPTGFPTKQPNQRPSTQPSSQPSQRPSR